MYMYGRITVVNGDCVASTISPSTRSVRNWLGAEENVRDCSKQSPRLRLRFSSSFTVVGVQISQKASFQQLARGLGAVARRPGHRQGVVGVARGRFGRLRRHLQQSSSTCIAECLYMVANGWIEFQSMALFSGLLWQALGSYEKFELGLTDITAETYQSLTRMANTHLNFFFRRCNEKYDRP